MDFEEFVYKKECPCCEFMYATGETLWVGVQLLEDDGTSTFDAVCEKCARELKKLSESK